MHSTEARSIGEAEQRLYLLSAWRDAPRYKEHFTEEQQVKFTLALIVINGWNLNSVGFGSGWTPRNMLPLSRGE